MPANAPYLFSAFPRKRLPIPAGNTVLQGLPGMGGRSIFQGGRYNPSTKTSAYQNPIAAAIHSKKFTENLKAREAPKKKKKADSKKRTIRGRHGEILGVETILS